MDARQADGEVPGRRETNGTVDMWTTDKLSAAFMGSSGISIPHLSGRINSFMMAYGINVY